MGDVSNPSHPIWRSTGFGAGSEQTSHGGIAMKFGFRTPSLRRMISARTSPRRFIAQSMGVKAPRGFGWFTNPKIDRIIQR